jgi:hypothetical protein
MSCSLSWEGNKHSVNKFLEIHKGDNNNSLPCHKSPPLVHVLGHVTQIHTLAPCYLGTNEPIYKKVGLSIHSLRNMNCVNYYIKIKLRCSVSAAHTIKMRNTNNI